MSNFLVGRNEGFKDTAQSLSNYRKYLSELSGHSSQSSSDSFKTCGDEIIILDSVGQFSVDTPSTNASTSDNTISPEKPFKCVNDCGRSFKRKDTLIYHLKHRCGVEPNKNLCKLCDYWTYIRGSLRRHLKRIHDVDPSKTATYAIFAAPMIISSNPFKCNNCNRSYMQKFSLKEHLESGCGEKPYSCTQCGFRSAWKHSFKKHLMTIHGIDQLQLASFGLGPQIRPDLPFKCDKCGKGYKTKATLRQHLKRGCGISK